MNVKIDKRAKFRQWLEKAEHDLVTAKCALRILGDRPYDAICFHAQQCAEKYFKSLLFWLDIDFPKTHDLRALIQLLPPLISKQITIDEVLPLNRYAIAARYPEEWEPITRSEAKAALAMARRIRRLIRQQFPRSALRTGKPGNKVSDEQRLRRI